MLCAGRTFSSQAQYASVYRTQSYATYRSEVLLSKVSLEGRDANNIRPHSRHLYVHALLLLVPSFLIPIIVDKPLSVERELQNGRSRAPMRSLATM